jgi:CII-binding regulator of phage lambda lysogenization HflD
MQYEKRGAYWSWRAVLLVCVFGVGLVTISSAARTGPEPQQDLIRLESRMTQLEQRLYSIDNNLRTLEQSRVTGTAARGVSQEDLARLQLDVQLLQRRLAEDECALAKLDERTLSPALRRKPGTRSDPCRSNVDQPLQLPDSRQ